MCGQVGLEMAAAGPACGARGGMGRETIGPMPRGWPVVLEAVAGGGGQSVHSYTVCQAFAYKGLPGFFALQHLVIPIF